MSCPRKINPCLAVQISWSVFWRKHFIDNIREPRSLIVPDTQALVNKSPFPSWPNIVTCHGHVMSLTTPSVLTMFWAAVWSLVRSLMISFTFNVIIKSININICIIIIVHLKLSNLGVGASAYSAIDQARGPKTYCEGSNLQNEHISNTFELSSCFNKKVLIRTRTR